MGKASWRNTANNMSKGSQMAISGRIRTGSYDAKDGTKRYVTEVVADRFGVRVHILEVKEATIQSGN